MEAFSYLCEVPAFMYLADTFIQSNLHYIQSMHFISSWIPWNSNPWPSMSFVLLTIWASFSLFIVIISKSMRCEVNEHDQSMKFFMVCHLHKSKHVSIILWLWSVVQVQIWEFSNKKHFVWLRKNECHERHWFETPRDFGNAKGHSVSRNLSRKILWNKSNAFKINFLRDIYWSRCE